MNTARRIAAAAAAAALGMALPTGPAMAAEEPCAPGQQVRGKVADLVRELKGHTTASSGRAVGQALREAMQTFGGEDADTAAERRALGKEIRALVSRRGDARSTLKRKAITVEIESLREQRERGRFTAAEKRELRAELRELRTAVEHAVDNPGIGGELSAQLPELFADVACER